MSPAEFISALPTLGFVRSPAHDSPHLAAFTIPINLHYYTAAGEAVHRTTERRDPELLWVHVRTGVIWRGFNLRHARPIPKSLPSFQAAIRREQFNASL